MKNIFVNTVFLIIFVNGTSQTLKKAETVSLNGEDVYYEVYGDGDPLFLLHAYTSSRKSWQPFVDDYSNDYEVYLVDLQGHGKSSPFTEKLSIRSAARQLHHLIKYLRLTSVKAIGFSYGGDVLYHLNLISPGITTSMITIGACGSWEVKDYPEFLSYFNYDNMENLKWMRDHHENETQIRAILDQMPNYSVSLSDEEIKQITAKTLVVLGDRDNSISLDCISNLRKNLPKSYLWILPDSHHNAHEGKNKSEFVRVSRLFLSGEMGELK